LGVPDGRGIHGAWGHHVHLCCEVIGAHQRRNISGASRIATL
jgi:hypothetical protein